MESITQAIHDFVQSAAEILSSGDATSFAQRMEQVLYASHSMLLKVVPAILEQVDEVIAAQSKRKRNWQIIRMDQRELTTSFGTVRFKRRYYRHKREAKVAYLLDQHLGITPHAKVNGDVRQQAVAQAAQVSYSKSAAVSTVASLSKMSVCNYIRDLGTFPKLVASGPRRSVENLYVEADEDHVALQDGKRVQVKLIYIHEGLQTPGARRELAHPCYLTWPLDGDNDLLWETVSTYIDEQYDTTALKHIFLSGDCASWIRKGEEWLYPCMPVLDGYHALKALRSLCGGKDQQIAAFMRYVQADAYPEAKTLCSEILSVASEEQTKSRRIAARYLLSNWQRLRNQYQNGAVGCSAEGHVSHILSERLSSRPCGWCRQNLETIAQLRIMRANGQLIRYEELAKRKETDKHHETDQLAEPLLKSASLKKALLKRMHIFAPVACSTIPILAQGQTSPLYKALHGLSLGFAAS